MTNFLLRLKPYFLPFISGILVGTSYPPFASWAVTFCWIPLWISVFEESSLKKVFLKGWITTFTLSLIGFHWIAYTAVSFGNIPGPLAILALLLFATFMHLHVPASLAFAHFLRRRVGVKVCAPTFFLLCALIQGLVERFWPMLFPWHLGYGLLYTRLEISQLAEFVGFQGLSSGLFLLNAAFATGFYLLKTQKVKAWILIAGTVFTFFFLNVAGSLIRPQLATQKNLNVLLVQANIGQFDKIMAEKNLTGLSGEVQRIVMEKYFQLTDEALKHHPEAQVIVWPETALADYLDMEYLSKERQLQLRSKLVQWKRALITGAYSRESRTETTFNGLFVFNDRGELADTAYRKSQLLAFGEYLPLGETFPWLYNLMPFASSFGRGPGPQVKTFAISNETFKVAPQICYESLDANFSRKGALLGADFLVNVTNDSWFGTSFEPFQHGTMNWARAVETRKPLVRSTNTGQSSVILQNGQVVLKSPLEQEWYGLASLPLLDNPPTFFMTWGHLDWALYLVVLLILVGRLKWKSSHHSTGI